MKCGPLDITYLMLTGTHGIETGGPCDAPPLTGELMTIDG